MASDLLEITADLSAALEWVLGDIPADPEPVVVVAACLDALAKGYGLSESGDVDEDPLARADLPALALELLRRLVADGDAEVTADGLRDRLYEVFDRLAEDPDARRQLNKKQPLTDVGLLRLGQIYWNLEGTADRARLPIRPARITKAERSGSRQVKADIPVPGHNKDFARLTWTARVNQKARGKSTGQGFRTQGARLAVLAARLLLADAPMPLPGLGPAAIERAADSGEGRGISAVRWPVPRHIGTPRVVSTDKPASPAEPPEALSSDQPRQRVLLGSPAEAGADYQRRATDDEIEALWADGGDRRIWLRGGPGLGKSYSARRVMQEAVANQSADHDELLIWVDSADAATVTAALSSAADRLRQQGSPVPGDSQDSAEYTARALLALLAISTWRWLFVLDNADAGSLIEAGLVPPGGNPNGRVLLTTRDPDHRIASHGRVVTARLFTAEEAEEYLRNDAHLVGPSTGPLAAATPAQTGALAETVGHHPLALSIAASTIVANAMTVPDWIEEFTIAGSIDTAADEPDRGGYPHLIGAAWQVALSRASHGLPEGVAERAALVAALQDPDGHPTWLWDRDSVVEWVAGGQTLARRHGMPVVVQRLIDNGIVELRGGTWRGGQVALHRLAARAVRELPDPATLAQIAGILAEEWLLELTANPSAASPDVLRGNLRPIGALGDLLPAAARQTVTALLGFRQPTGTGRKRKLAESLAPHLDRAGTTGRIEKARLTLEIADDYAALGRAEQARTAYTRAAELYRQVIEEHSLGADELALCLKRLGDIEGWLGNPGQALSSRERAAGLLERLADTEADTATTCSRLSELVELHALLGNQERKVAALARAEEIVTHRLDDPPSTATDSDVRSHGDTWRTLARLMEQAGRTDAAKQCLTRESAIYERSPELWIRNVGDWVGSVQELALLHTRTGEWSNAEHLLTGLTHLDQAPWVDSLSEGQALAAGRTLRVSRTDTLVLLASVQTHLGHPEDADRSLTRAAEDDGPRHRRAMVSECADPSDEAGQLHEERLRLEGSLEGLDLRLALHRLASESFARGRRHDTLRLEGSLLDLAQHDADASPGDTEAELELANMHYSAGLTRSLLGEEDDALSHFTKAVDSLQLLTELDPGREDLQRELAEALDSQAESLESLGRLQTAADRRARCVDAYRRLVELSSDNRDAAKGLSDALSDLASTQADLGNLDEAVDCYQESISILEELAEQAPDHHAARIDLANTLGQFAIALISHERPEEGLEPLQRHIDIYSDLIARQEDESLQHLFLGKYAWAQGLLALLLEKCGSPDAADTHHIESVKVWRALAERAPDDREIQEHLAFELASYGASLNDRGEQEQAVDHFIQSANILQLLHDLNPDVRPDMLLGVLEILEETLRDLGRTDEADETLARASALADEYPDEAGQDEQ